MLPRIGTFYKTNWSSIGDWLVNHSDFYKACLEPEVMMFKMYF